VYALKYCYVNANQQQSHAFSYVQHKAAYEILCNFQIY